MFLTWNYPESLLFWVCWVEWVGGIERLRFWQNDPTLSVSLLNPSLFHYIAPLHSELEGAATQFIFIFEEKNCIKIPINYKDL